MKLLESSQEEYFVITMAIWPAEIKQNHQSKCSTLVGEVSEWWYMVILHAATITC